MVDLFEFASAVLVELAIARKDVQRFEQSNGLFWTNFGYRHGQRV
jgi:hypothetical protein